MSSFNRNTHRANSLQRRWALGAVLALSLTSGTALADGAHRFVFTAYSDAVGGGDIIAGRYGAALAELTSRSRVTDLNAAASNTNRCVAYAMTLQWQAAHSACDAAVSAASEQRNMSPAWWSWARTPDDDYLALAYANRAVLYWLSRDDTAAQKDLARAQELSPRADFVAQNVAALEGHRAVALAAAPVPRS
jgi:hypothetical protein